MRKVYSTIVSSIKDIPMLKVDLLPQRYAQIHHLLEVRKTHGNIFLLGTVELEKKFIFVKDLLEHYF